MQRGVGPWSDMIAKFVYVNGAAGGPDPVGGDRWVITLPQKIEIIRFNLDCDAHLAGEGGKTPQPAILDRLLCVWLPVDNKDVDVKTAEGKATVYARADRWRHSTAWRALFKPYRLLFLRFSTVRSLK